MIPYSVNAEPWADHAIAERFLAVPGTESIKSGRRGAWTFPEGSVLAKTVSLELEQGNPATRRRMETQVLHFEDKSWRPYTYIWNDDQTDAALAEAEGSSQHGDDSRLSRPRRPTRAAISVQQPSRVHRLP